MTAPQPILRFGLLALVAALLASCGLFEGSDPTIEGARPDDRRPSVTVLERGAEPHRSLEFDLPAGSTVELDLSFDIDVTQRTDDAESSVVLDPPRVAQSIRLTVVSSDAAGATISFEVVDASIDPDGTTLTDAEVLQLTAAVQRVVGLTGELDVDRSGGARRISYDPPDDLPPSVAEPLARLEEGLAGLLPVLPDEPVGRGARWRVVSRSDAGGLALRQTTEYEITGFDGPRITYRAVISQTAPEQAVVGDTRVLASDVAGTATGQVSTSDLSMEAETTLNGTQVVEQGSGEGALVLTQDLQVLVAVGARRGPA